MNTHISHWKICLIITLLAFGLLPAMNGQANATSLWRGHTFANTSFRLQSSALMLGATLGQPSAEGSSISCNRSLLAGDLQADKPDPIFYLYLPLVVR
jgi:hypothetical protein